MDLCINQSPRGGTLRAVTSKSAAHRLLICAALADRETFVGCTDTSNDIEATADCLCAFGAQILRTPDGFAVQPIGEIPKQTICRSRESGATFRFLLPVAAALGIAADFLPEGRIPQRPLSPLYEVLQEHGISLSPQGSVPFSIRGKLQGGAFTIAADVSSQFISGLLFAAPLTGTDCEIHLTGTFASRSYVDMTCDAMGRFGVTPVFRDMTYSLPANSRYRSPGRMIAEGDWSNAAFWLAAGAIGKAPVTVTGLRFDSLQGDMAILPILKTFGARVEENIEAGSCTVYPSILHGMVIDAENIPDLVPILSLVACCAEGETRITHAARLRLKESDRLQTVCATLRALGGKVEETGDGLRIEGGSLQGGVCDSFNDHRIAMTAAIASCCTAGEITVTDAGAVSKSYPRFWEDFTAMGGQITTIRT